MKRYPLWALKDVLLEKPHLGIALNASNELLQTLFLDSKIPFSAFAKVILESIEYFKDAPPPQNLEEIYKLHEEVRNFSDFLVKKYYL